MKRSTEDSKTHQSRQRSRRTGSSKDTIGKKGASRGEKRGQESLLVSSTNDVTDAPTSATSSGGPDEGPSSSSNPRNSSDSDAKPAASLGKGQAASKPRNFPQRLLYALQNEVAPDCVYWAGQGRAIALDVKKLKEGDILQEYFHSKNYSVFLRTCNRWGFRRVNFYSVPPGVVTYQCSLFRRDEPQLVNHMRMDSDVQEVFSRHKANEEAQSGSRKGHYEPQGDEIEGQPPEEREQQLAGLLSRFAGRDIQPGDPQMNRLHTGTGDTAVVSANRTSEGNSSSDSPPYSSSRPSSGETAPYASSRPSSRETTAPSESQPISQSAQETYQRLLDLSRVYLRLMPDGEDDQDPVRTILKLLLDVTESGNHMTAEQEQFLNNILNSAAPDPAPPPPPPPPPPAPVQLNPETVFLLNQLLFHWENQTSSQRSQHPAPNEPPPQNRGGPPDIQQLLQLLFPNQTRKTGPQHHNPHRSQS